MRPSGAVSLLIVARCFVEAVSFAALAALAHAGTQGRDPLPVLPTTLALFGAALLLVSLVREIGGERRSGTILVVTLAASVAWGLTLPMRDADGFATLSRMVLFGLLGEGYLWRVVSVARGSTRWTDARNAIPLAGLAVTIAVLAPGRIDRAPFAALALLVVAASGLALSLARSTEELALARGTSGKMGTSSATSATVVVGLLAIVTAVFVPTVQDALGAFGAWLGPLATRLLYLLILPFAYVASYLIEVLRPLLANAKLPERPPLPQTTPEEDLELLRQIDAARPYVFGGLELVIVAIGVLVALVLLERMLRERRMDLPEGVTLEHEYAEGMSLLDSLRALRPVRRAKRRRPRDDGTPAAALRLLYWRFLELAERRGAGWRGSTETPGEHQARIASADPRWGDAAPIVRAFEDLRYGELAPDAAALARSRDALRSLEAAPRAS
ncbi:MAG TPA: DUF4129 domain-containing protein [Candidatus Limnocylindria bacterium]|nr:DUF4129 domain-containing protein [Candidatus Limnocylindria bacterium]